MASPRNQHCASCIGTLSFPIPGDAASIALNWGSGCCCCCCCGCLSLLTSLCGCVFA